MLEQAVSVFGSLPGEAQFLLLAAASLIAAKLVELFSVGLVKEVVKKRDGELEKIVYENLHTPVYITVALVGLYISVTEASLFTEAAYYLENAVLSLTILVWSWAAIKTGDRILEFVKRTEDSRFDYEFAPIFGNVWTAIVLTVAGFGIVSGVWGVDVTPFLASAGILGVVGGLAAKDTIANFFGGLALYFDNTYKLGDFVRLDDGEEGVVVDIGIRSTNLKTRNDMIVTVPNSILNSSKVINQSAPNNTGRLDIEVGVSYDSDIEQVEDIMLEVAEESNSVLESPSPRVRFQEFGENALNYELFVWIPNPIERVRARHRLNREIFKRFQEEGIEIPYPQRTLHYGEDSKQERKRLEEKKRSQEE
jgi:small-conductance mechanosensitive channel